MNYAMITGASSGIGLEYARQLALQGYAILVVSNQREANETVAVSLAKEYGVTALPVYSDLSQDDAAQQLYDFCREKSIEVEILISNAGILHFGKLVHTDEKLIQKIIAIHCTTPVKLCRLFGADMCKKGRGHILLMSSMTSWTLLPTMSLYGSTKVFLRNFGKCLWYELQPFGVGVTTVFPSAVDTSFYDIDSKSRRRLRQLGLIISPQKLARGALKAMFRRKRQYIPDFWTKLEIGLCRVTPTWVYRLFLRLPAIRRILERL